MPSAITKCKRWGIRFSSSSFPLEQSPFTAPNKGPNILHTPSSHPFSILCASSCVEGRGEKGGETKKPKWHLPLPSPVLHTRPSLSFAVHPAASIAHFFSRYKCKDGYPFPPRCVAVRPDGEAHPSKIKEGMEWRGFYFFLRLPFFLLRAIAVRRTVLVTTNNIPCTCQRRTNVRSP